jgi:hypothetical protein
MRLRAALKAAVRDCLRIELGFTAGECEVCPQPGRPFPSAGQRFLAVCDAQQTANHTMSVDSYYTFQVVASVKVGAVPFDRTGVGVIDAEQGVNDLVESVAAVVFAKQWQIVGDANAKLSPAVNGVLEAPRPMNLGTPEEVGFDWFGAEAPQGRGGRTVAGYKASVSFICRLMQLQASGTF